MVNELIPLLNDNSDRIKMIAEHFLLCIGTDACHTALWKHALNTNSDRDWWKSSTRLLNAISHTALFRQHGRRGHPESRKNFSLKTLLRVTKGWLTGNKDLSTHA
jgi:hypothetical protein